MADGCLHRGQQGGAGGRHGQYLRDISDQGVRGAVQERRQVGKGDEGLHSIEGEGVAEAILLLHDLPEVREGLREELRGHGGPGVARSPAGEFLQLPNGVVGGYDG